MKSFQIGATSILSAAIVLIAATWFELDAQSKPATYRVEVGKPHPDFALPRIDNGKPLQLSDYRGKKVLLVHFASW